MVVWLNKHDQHMIARELKRSLVIVEFVLKLIGVENKVGNAYINAYIHVRYLL